MPNDQFDGKAQGGAQGEDDAEDIIQYDCTPICYVRNPFIPHPHKPHSWLERDFLVYTQQSFAFLPKRNHWRFLLEGPLRECQVMDGFDWLKAHVKPTHFLWDRVRLLCAQERPRQAGRAAFSFE